ncbi:WD repeat-containing protein 63-like [Pseudomyrmex gracilis]|uniref:WD repeat-containing protein 63-like n=1 Tax=Pseudomyrmex gracilis TaxID=219809 RepID=UPI0009959D36|nr:WD repeat-containing protein 63-like [Pseudomyrmex gracilis]
MSGKPLAAKLVLRWPLIRRRYKNTMSRKGVKYLSSWTLCDENIENVERVSFTPAIQRELGCAVNEHVFLEYPWAYVARDTVLRLANKTGSPLESYREKVNAYGGDNFLVGYSSTQLIACDFVICLTEDAKLTIEKRNAEIKRRIWNDVTEKIRKTCKSWKSLGSEATLEDSLVKKTRDLFEVEICLPFKFLALSRELHDRTSKESWDSYVELVPYEKFKNIEKKCISRMIQTHFEPREIEVQTYPGYPKNAWTQYFYEDTLGSENDNGEAEKEESIEEKSESEEKSKTEGSSKEEISEADVEQKPVKSALELFLDDRAQEMIDAVRYNTVVNVHADDIETLARLSESEIDRPRDEITYKERVSLLDLRFTANKIVSDVSWHPTLAEYVTISYVTAPPLHDEDTVAPKKTVPTVLLWSLADSLRPQLLLRCQQEIRRISFCPINADFLIGGSASGRVIVWNICGQIEDHHVEENNQIDELDLWTRDTIPAISAFMESDQSHEMTIRGIQWLPDNYRIEPSGKLTKLSTRSSCQFVTTSEDGTVAIWDLLKYSVTSQLKPNDCKNIKDTFRPTYRLRLSADMFFTPLCLCLPSDSVFQENSKRRDEIDSTEMNRAKRLWIGTAQGHFACCSWEGQVFDVETSDLEECKLLSCCFAHDGSVTAILRSPHLPDVLLTIGGSVFAIWKDDYLDSPLFRRRSDCVYTACCWSNQPGTFMIGTYMGDVEIWDIKTKTSRPVFKRIISMKPITLLSLQESCKQGFKLIGVADYNSAFHVLDEAKNFEDNVVERMDWFEEYVWREVRRKKIFHSWEKDFLENDPTAVVRRQARAEEERKQKLEAARLKLQMEHEERLRLEAEEKLRKTPKSKDTIWKLRQQERMKKAFLEKKKLVPRELEEKRQPLVSLAEERKLKMIKAKNKVALQDEYFSKATSQEFPEYYLQDEEDKSLLERPKIKINEETVAALLTELSKVRDEARRKVAEKSSYVPKFDWKYFANKKKKNL